MVQLAIQNSNTAMNGDIFQIISLVFLLIVSVAEAAYMFEVHVMVEYPALDRYRSALVFLRTLMELLQVHGYS